MPSSGALRATLALVPILVLIVIAPAAAESPLAAMPSVTLQIGRQAIRAEVAATATQRVRGMMFRRELARDAGMLFIFGGEQGGPVCLWMRNTYIPLSAAFIDRDGRILNIADMEPHSETMHCANGRAEYVLEVNRGAFTRAGVKPGTRIDGLPSAR